MKCLHQGGFVTEMQEEEKFNILMLINNMDRHIYRKKQDEFK